MESAVGMSRRLTLTGRLLAGLAIAGWLWACGEHRDAIAAVSHLELPLEMNSQKP
ncbi:hypothetical protein [Parahaliea maris]|uniref:hypothetical protein n=1 Tax=Parahaliea maris TaxID=2716870 RepID=UPI00164FBC03|nr:hypothetical protein [Parahaliea maris]